MLDFEEVANNSKSKIIMEMNERKLYKESKLNHELNEKLSK
jgi:hypothetical protein